MRAVHIPGFQQRDGNAVRHCILFWIARKYFFRERRCLYRLAALHIQAQQHRCRFAAFVAVRKSFEKFSRFRALSRRGQRPHLQHKRRLVRWVQLQDAVGQANGFGVVALIQNLLHGVMKCFDGFFLLPHGELQFRQAKLHAHIFRLGFQKLAQEQRGLRLAARLQLHFGELQKQGPRLAQHALLNVKFRQAFQRTAFLGSELGDFFVDGDGFGRESVVQKIFASRSKYSSA